MTSNLSKAPSLLIVKREVEIQIEGPYYKEYLQHGRCFNHILPVTLCHIVKS